LHRHGRIAGRRDSIADRIAIVTHRHPADTLTVAPPQQPWAKPKRIKDWSKKLSPEQPQAKDFIRPEFSILMVYRVYVLDSAGLHVG
jgi:hypothetical protein